MSSDLGHSGERPRADDARSDATSSRRPMSQAGRTRLEGIMAGRARDPEFLRKVEAVQRMLGEETTPQQ